MSGADALAALLAGQSGPQAGGDSFAVVETASVTAVTAGAGKGGTALVTVSWRGARVTAARVDSYTSPTVGDLVLLAHHGDVPYILGRLTGLPA